MFLLDTNACIRVLNNSSLQLVKRLQNHNSSDLLLCSIVKAELVYGAYHSTQVAKNLRLLEKFFKPFPSLPFDDLCIENYGRIRNDLAREGTPIGPNDLIIATTAVTHNLTLITHNLKEFSRIPGLHIEDWEVN